MTSSSSAKKVLEKLEKLRVRKDTRLVMPQEGCHAVGTHLAGMFLIEHIEYFIDLVRRDCE